ncbi:sugar kinase [Aestuariispira insulae]|uniref:2-dehydro-3-deoxygluconokinase n=1 Tax=Aestuariispira insulae TaxID=1461337 RepID=A0A3D9HRY4_9PROT|nr:sugar kinase [Aestuariispira insulae]RED52219.1 2-dehydro-3-deoxygluconokinase [Aestuariispira insulae]
MQTLTIACIGEAMLEISEDPKDPGHLDRHAAGDALFTALYLARLLKGQARVMFVTQVGDDTQTKTMIESWRQAGLDVSMVHQVPDGMTGRYAVETDEDGSRHCSFWPGSDPFRDFFRNETTLSWLDRLRRVDLLYFSGATLAALHQEGRETLMSLAARVRAADGKVAFDGSFRPGKWEHADIAADWVGQAYKRSDIALPTYDDDSELAILESGGVMLNRFLLMGCSEVVIKREAEPYFVACDGERHIVEAGYLPEMMQTPSTCDSFNAGYLAARLVGWGGRQAALLGHEVADRVNEGGGSFLAPGAISDLRPRDLRALGQHPVDFFQQRP